MQNNITPLSSEYIQAWDPGLVYNILDMVSYKGLIYEAQSSIAGDIPGQVNSSWKLVKTIVPVEQELPPVIKKDPEPKAKSKETQFKQDELIVKEVADNYTFKRFKAHNHDVKSVHMNLLLSTKGPYDTILSWKSSAPSVIAVSGKVTQPECGEDYPVVLFLSISRGKFTVNKEFVVWVTSLGACTRLNDKDCVNEAYHQLTDQSLLANNVSNTQVSSHLYLPNKTYYECQVSWLCLQSNLINAKGDITQTDQDQNVTIYAIISKGQAKVCKSFTFTILAKR